MPPPPSGNNDQAQLDIQNAILAALQAQNEELRKIGSALGQNAQTSQNMANAANAAANAMNNAAGGTSNLTQAANDAADAANGAKINFNDLSLELQEAADEVENLESKTNKYLKTAAGMNMIYSIFKTAGGMIDATIYGITASITGFFEILKTGMGVIDGVTQTFINAAAELDQLGQQIFEANENIRESFGDLSKNEGLEVKEMFHELRESQEVLGKSGRSLINTIGEMPAQLEYVNSLAQGLGSSFHSLTDSFKGNVTSMMVLDKGAGLTAENFKFMALSAAKSGKDMSESLQDVTISLAAMQKDMGISAKVVKEALSGMMNDTKNFGDLSEKELVAVAGYTTKLGAEMSDLQGIMAQFDTFDSAAESAGKLSEAFGMNVDVMKMMMTDNPAERIDELRRSFEAAGNSVADLDRRQLDYLANSTGQNIDNIKKIFSTPLDEMSFDDFQNKLEEATKPMTMEEATNEMAKNIKKLTNVFLTLQKGLGAIGQFFHGFTTMMGYMPEVRKVINSVRMFYRVFLKSGAKFAGLINKVIAPGGALFTMRNLFESIFDVGRAQKFMDTFHDLFEGFFNNVMIDPSLAMKRLFLGIIDAFKEFTDGQLSASGELFSYMENMLIGLFQMIADNADSVIEEAATSLSGILEEIFDGLSNSAATHNSLLGSIGAALTNVIMALYEHVFPVMLDLFTRIFDALWPILQPYLMAMFGIFILKVIGIVLTTAIMTGALSTMVSFFKDLTGGLFKKLGLGGGGDGDAPAESKGILESIKDAFTSVPDLLETLVDVGVYIRSMTARDWMNLGVGIIALAGLFTIIGTVFLAALGVVTFMAKKMVDFGAAMKTMALLTAVMLFSIPMILASAALGGVIMAAANATGGIGAGVILAAIAIGVLVIAGFLTGSALALLGAMATVVAAAGTIDKEKAKGIFDLLSSFLKGIVSPFATIIEASSGITGLLAGLFGVSPIQQATGFIQDIVQLIIDKIIPQIFTPLAKLTIPGGVDLLKAKISVIASVADLIASLGKTSASMGKVAVSAGQGYIFDNPKIMKDMMDKMTKVLKVIIPGVKSIIFELKDMLSIKLDENQTKAMPAIAQIIGAVASVTGAVSKPLGMLGNLDPSVFENPQKIKQLFSGISGVLKSMFDGMSKELPGLITKMANMVAGLKFPKDADKSMAALSNMMEAVHKMMIVANGLNQEEKLQNLKDLGGNLDTIRTSITDVTKFAQKVKASGDIKTIQSVIKEVESIETLLEKLPGIDAGAAKLKQVGNALAFNGVKTVKLETAPLQLNLKLNVTMDAKDVAVGLMGPEPDGSKPYFKPNDAWRDSRGQLEFME